MRLGYCGNARLRPASNKPSAASFAFNNSNARAAAPAPALYARVDMIAGTNGALKIMELELIEPALFLHHAPDKGAAFASAVRTAAARK